MKVKNGIANSVSLFITPKMRSGMTPSKGQSRLTFPPESGASSTPMKKYRSPTALREKATG